MKRIENKTKIELLNYILDAAKEERLNNLYVCDIHNEVFNTDYYIIGYYQSEQWLINNYGIFDAIDTITEYEKMNFGEVNTNLSSSEHVCNMLTYILGEEILSELNTINNNWDNRVNEEIINELINEIEEKINELN